MSTDHPLTISVGSHLILDMLGCSLDLRDKKVLEDLARTIAKEANLTILASHFYQFYPEGVTGTLVLTESHIHLHSWPEYDYLAVDIFVCGDQSRAVRAEKLFISYCCPTEVKRRVIERGI